VKFYKEIGHKHTYKCNKNYVCALRITNMATVQSFEVIPEKSNVVGN
jgi:hypothetical protein